MLNVYQRDRILTVLGILVCAGGFWWMADLFRIPSQRGFAELLVQQGFVAVGLVFVLVIAGVIVATLITRTVQVDAGLFCVCAGLAAISAREGRMQTLLQRTSSSGVYFKAALEMVDLLLIFLAAVAVVGKMKRGGLVKERKDLATLARPADWKYVGVAMAVQAAIMAALAALLVRTDARQQVLAGVGVASFTATCALGSAFSFQRLRGWYLVGPALVAIVGYLCAWLWPGDIGIGLAANALARPLPIDYAAAGFGGAILGSWATAEVRDVVIGLFLGYLVVPSKRGRQPAAKR